MNKQELRSRLMDIQGGVCIVPNCIESPSPWSKKTLLCLHRIVAGSLGGRYVEGNIVLVCPSHHRVIEGLSIEEIRAEDGLTFRPKWAMSWAKPVKYISHNGGVEILARTVDFPKNPSVLVRRNRTGKRFWTDAWHLKSTGGGEALLRAIWACPVLAPDANGAEPPDRGIA